MSVTGLSLGAREAGVKHHCFLCALCVFDLLVALAVALLGGEVSRSRRVYIGNRFLFCAVLFQINAILQLCLVSMYV